MLRRFLMTLFATLPIALAGCNTGQAKTEAPKPPEVLVATPVVKEITDVEFFTGRTEAVASVDVRARVTGYLDKVNFKEGAIVEKGQLLFEIDPRTYEADLQGKDADVSRAEVHFQRLTSDYQRAVDLLATKAISRQEFDQIKGDRNEAESAVQVSKANRDVSKLNLSFTKVVAPIKGRISRQMIDQGNLVKADDTVLTNIVTTDPMYASFDVDERTVLRFRRLLQEGKIQSARDTKINVGLALSDEEDFKLAGVIDFVDNKVDAFTGTLRIRGVFDNPRDFLAPGMFVRVKVPVGLPYQAVMIPDRALGTEQAQKFLYVLNDKNEAERRNVRTGSQQEGLRVITEGLRAGERFVLSGLQRVRSGTKVTPKEAPAKTAG